MDALALSAQEVSRNHMECALTHSGTGISNAFYSFTVHCLIHLTVEDLEILIPWHFEWKDTNRALTFLVDSEVNFQSPLTSKVCHLSSVGCCGLGQNEGRTISWELWKQEFIFRINDSDHHFVLMKHTLNRAYCLL